MERRIAQIEESVARYLEQLDTADRQEPSAALQTKTNRLKEKIETLKQQMRRYKNHARKIGDACAARCCKGPRIACLTLRDLLSAMRAFERFAEYKY